MAQDEFFGITYTVVHGTFTLEGILDVKINQKGGPEIEQVDKTRYGHTVYTYTPHPLGSKGQPVTTLTVIVQASLNALADDKATAIPLNTPASTTVAFEPGTANTNQFDMTTLELVRRTTKIPFRGKTLATTTLVFEANGVGTWSSPA